MSSSKAPLAATLASLSILAAAAGIASPAAARDCFEAIPGPGAQKIFDGLAEAKPADGCTLENVTTDKWQMKIEWKKGGRLQEAILVVPSSCAIVKEPRGPLTAIIPGSVESACPSAVELTRKLVDGGALGDLVKVTDAIPVPELDGRRSRLTPRILGLAVGGLAAVLAVGGGLVARRRRRAAQAAKSAEGSPSPEAKTENAEAKTDNVEAPAALASAVEPPAAERVPSSPVTLEETPNPPPQPEP